MLVGFVDLALWRAHAVLQAVIRAGPAHVVDLVLRGVIPRLCKAVAVVGEGEQQPHCVHRVGHGRFRLPHRVHERAEYRHESVGLVFGYHKDQPHDEVARPTGGEVVQRGEHLVTEVLRKLQHVIVKTAQHGLEHVALDQLPGKVRPRPLERPHLAQHLQHNLLVRKLGLSVHDDVRLNGDLAVRVGLLLGDGRDQLELCWTLVGQRLLYEVQLAVHEVVVGRAQGLADRIPAEPPLEVLDPPFHRARAQHDARGRHGAAQVQRRETGQHRLRFLYRLLRSCYQRQTDSGTRTRARDPFPTIARLAREEVVGDVDRRGEGVHLVVDGVLNGALLLLESRLELVQVLAARGRELGLDARLEARLRLGHELRAHVVPRRVVGRRDGDARVREVADLDLRLDLLLDLRGEEKNG
ncbi:MAG: hypothetical protein CL844_05565 [Crocinitomicaceae bacterium]|nr:hypothetical protein [Crocinitomicaceae bacterium]